MTKVNPYTLLSEAIYEALGNAGTQSDDVARLFVTGLFDRIELETIEDEFHADFDGFKGIGATPAEALFGVMQEMIITILKQKVI